MLNLSFKDNSTKAFSVRFLDFATKQILYKVNYKVTDSTVFTTINNGEVEYFASNTENQIFTVFDIPNIGKYPTSQDKLKGIGYIYGITFNTHIWGCLTDEPLPQGWIDTIRMNIEVEREGRVNRIVIN